MDYPNSIPGGLQERFVLLKMNLQGRLAFALEHRLSFQENGAELMASRYFYVSNTLNGQQGIGILLNNGMTLLQSLIPVLHRMQLLVLVVVPSTLLGSDCWQNLWKTFTNRYKKSMLNDLD